MTSLIHGQRFSVPFNIKSTELKVRESDIRGAQKSFYFVTKFAKKLAKASETSANGLNQVLLSDFYLRLGFGVLFLGTR